MTDWFLETGKPRSTRKAIRKELLGRNTEGRFNRNGKKVGDKGKRNRVKLKRKKERREGRERKERRREGKEDVGCYCLTCVKDKPTLESN